MHSVVVGNGIIALSVAFRLAQRSGAGDTITIVGEGARGGSATLAAAAMLNSFAEIDAGSLETETDLYRFELSHLATRMWPKFEDELIGKGGSFLPHGCSACQGIRGGGCFCCGTYVINNGAADRLDDENFDAIIDGLESFNEQYDVVSPSDIPNYMPEERFRALRAIFIPGEGWINPRLMVEKLDKILALYPNVTRIEGRVARLEASGGRIDRAVLESGDSIEGDAFLLATGATVSRILDNSQLGLEMQRVFYGVGVSVEIRSPEFPHTHCIRTPNRGLACGIYTAPYYQGPDAANDHIIVGATNLVSPEPLFAARLTNVESLTRNAIEQINKNFYRAEVVRINIGWRPTSQDTYPLLGKTAIPNLIIASGTKRDGFHMAPLLADYLSSLMCGESVDPRFSVFAPDRKLIASLTREQAIRKAVRHQISAAYQHGYNPPKSRLHDKVEEAIRADLERLHDAVGAVDWGIPPEMLDMYRYGHAKA